MNDNLAHIPYIAENLARLCQTAGPPTRAWLGEPVSNTATMRVIGPGPLVPGLLPSPMPST